MRKKSQNPQLELYRRLDADITRAAEVKLLLDAHFGKILQKSDLNEKAAAMGELVLRIRSLVDAAEGGLTLCEPFEEPPLSHDEYLLPPELAGGRHEKLLAFLKSDQLVTSLPYQGMLLHGRTGTGKTEYVRHLKHELADSPVDFYVANISAIVNAAEPGVALRRLYNDLQVQAEEGGKKVVLLFDEFEVLVRQFLRKEIKAVVNESHSDSGPQRHSSHTKNESSTALEVDKRGEELLAAIKSILRGTGCIDKVYTVATSNVDDFSEALGTRLEFIKIDTLNVPVEIIEGSGMLLYQSHATILPRILKLMQATHFRRYRQRTPVLETLLNELMPLLASLEQETADIRNGERKIPLRHSGNDYVNRERQETVNKLWMHELFKFFGVPAPKDDIYSSMLYRTNHYFDTEVISPEAIDIPQIRIARDFYLNNLDSFQSIDQIKRRLALIIFPQLTRIKEVAEPEGVYDERKLRHNTPTFFPF